MEANKENPIIQLVGLGKQFQTMNGPVTALEDINLEIRYGEVFGIIGLSGAGKSTLVRCINYLEVPTSGKVIFEGKNLSVMKDREKRLARQSMGMIFQQFNLLSQRNVLQNVCFPLEIAGVSRAEAKKRAEELLTLVGLEDRMKAYPAQLSGGQKQRVAIARAMATNPKVLLCDEATSALDPKTTRQILELIRDINQKLNITVVIITHQMSVVKEVCSHVAILDDGCVAESGMVGTVFAAPKSEAGRRLVFPGGADAQVYNPQDEKLVRLVFKDSKTTSIPLIARLAAEEGVFCNVISASTQKLSETVYGSMMLGIPSTQYDKAVAFIHNVANVQVEEVDHHVQ